MKNIFIRKYVSLILAVLSVNGVVSACPESSEDSDEAYSHSHTQKEDNPLIRPKPIRRNVDQNNIPEMELDDCIDGLIERIEDPDIREEVENLYQDQNEDFFDALKNTFKITPEYVGRVKEIIKESNPEKFRNYKENHSKAYRIIDEKLKCKCILPFIHNTRMNFAQLIKKVDLLRNQLIQDMKVERDFLSELQKNTHFISQPFFAGTIVYSALDHVFLKKSLALLNRNFGTTLSEFRPLYYFDGCPISWFVSDMIKDHLNFNDAMISRRNMRTVCHSIPKVIEDIDKLRSDIEKYKVMSSSSKSTEASAKNETISRLLAVCVSRCDYIKDQINYLPLYKHYLQEDQSNPLTFSQLNVIMAIVLNAMIDMQDLLDSVIKVL